MKKLLLLVMTGFFPNVGATSEIYQQYVCDNGHIYKAVEIVRAKMNSAAPCQVNYQKSSTASKQTLWSAQSDKNYCKRKAERFIKKLEESGFECHKQLKTRLTNSSDENVNLKWKRYVHDNYTASYPDGWLVFPSGMDTVTVFSPPDDKGFELIIVETGRHRHHVLEALGTKSKKCFPKDVVDFDPCYPWIRGLHKAFWILNQIDDDIDLNDYDESKYELRSIWGVSPDGVIEEQEAVYWSLDTISGITAYKMPALYDIPDQYFEINFSCIAKTRKLKIKYSNVCKQFFSRALAYRYRDKE